MILTQDKQVKKESPELFKHILPLLVCVYVCVSMFTSPLLLTYVQWNLSIENTIGSQLAVLYREVSLIQR